MVLGDVLLGSLEGKWGLSELCVGRRTTVDLELLVLADRLRDHRKMNAAVLRPPVTN
jgi:hypothetical protein